MVDGRCFVLTKNTPDSRCAFKIQHT